jgi:flagellar motor protein MotB
MPSKLAVTALGLAALCVGCQGVWVQKDVYDRDVNQLREYSAALERDNADLKAKADAYDRLRAEMDIRTGSGADYAALAEQLKAALAGVGMQEGRDFEFDPATGKFTFATDLLFGSGSYTVTARGKEILREFARANRGSRLKIAGHTDTRPIVQVSTKSKLDTDTNLELSAKRAVAVMHELIKGGIPERNMWIEGHGSAHPRSGAHKANRRVEIFIAATGAEKTSQK